MEAFDECNLTWDTLLNLLEVADARLLGLLASSTQELSRLASQDRYWHKCFGSVVASVPISAKSWRERLQCVRRPPDSSVQLAGIKMSLSIMISDLLILILIVSRHRQVFADYDAAIDAKTKDPLACLLILPPGIYRRKLLTASLFYEGYLADEYDCDGSADDEATTEQQHTQSGEKGADSSKDPSEKFAGKVVLDANDEPPALYVINASAAGTFKNITFYSVGLGVYCARVTASFKRCQFYCKFGVLSHQARLSFEDCDFRPCSYVAYRERIATGLPDVAAN